MTEDESKEAKSCLTDEQFKRIEDIYRKIESEAMRSYAKERRFVFFMTTFACIIGLVVIIACQLLIMKMGAE